MQDSINNKIPKVFISYSWDDDSHKEWVLNLAFHLRSRGVDAILDVWELKAGKDKDFFMEYSVRESDKVLMIMTPNYKLKAENRNGGVGSEISMIRAEKFNSQETEKFIPILRSDNRENCVPLFVKSLVDIDMSKDENFEVSLEELLRVLFNEPKIIKPPIGTKPEFPKKDDEKINENFDLKSEYLENKENNFQSEWVLEPIRDPNNISICISHEVPIVVLFGPECSGKTMAIRRLTRYLEKIGYAVEPDRIFRPSTDKHFTTLCEEFHENVDSDLAASGTSPNSFILITVYNEFYKPVCQVLDACGLTYFDNSTEFRYRKFFNEILMSNNQIILIYLFELNWKNQKLRNIYSRNIIETKKHLGTQDKSIFMLTKIDQYQHLNETDENTKKILLKEMDYHYPLIFKRFENKNPITKHFSPYNFDLIAFSAGKFNLENDLILSFTPSNDSFPESLWKSILKRIKK